MRAYLSGAIEHAPDGGKEWRKELSRWLKATLGHRSFDPSRVPQTVVPRRVLQSFRNARFSDPPRFKRVLRKLIDRDLKELLHRSDYLICYWNRAVLKGGGSHGEVTTAYSRGIPVYLVLGMPRAAVSGWILACAEREFSSFADLQEFLSQRYRGRRDHRG